MRRSIAVELYGPVLRRDSSGKSFRLVRGSKRALSWLRGIGWRVILIVPEGGIYSAIMQADEFMLPRDEIREARSACDRVLVGMNAVNFSDWGKALEIIRRTSRMSPARKRYLSNRREGGQV